VDGASIEGKGEDMSFMRGSLITILLVALSLPNNSSASGQKIADTVSINGQFRLDDAENFDFKRLSVFTQHQLGKYGALVVDGSFTADEKGRFVIGVPAGSRVSMQITTADPTIMDSEDAPDNPDNNRSVGFYELEKGKKHTLLFKELYVSEDSSSEMELTIQLYRGASFSVCLPEGMTSGSIHFHQLSGKRQNDMSMVSFSDSKTVHESLIGGLNPGLWEVFYIDDNDRMLNSLLLDLRRDQIFPEKCQ
jgi:hypothetical protein